MAKCHGWFNRKNWYYPVPGWKIRVCKVCGQPQTQDGGGYSNSTVGEFLSMIKWAQDRDQFKKDDKVAGLSWLKENGVV